MRRAAFQPKWWKIIPFVRHRQHVDDLTEGRRVGLHVGSREAASGCEEVMMAQGIGEVLRRSFHRKIRVWWKVGSGLIVIGVISLFVSRRMTFIVRWVACAFPSSSSLSQGKCSGPTDAKKCAQCQRVDVMLWLQYVTFFNR